MAGVLIVGLARSGVGAARLLDSMGKEVTVTDMRTAQQLESQLSKLPPRVNLLLGGHPEWAFTGAEMVVVSPGVPLTLEPIQAAISAGVPVIGELELAYRALPTLPYYAITGTNGKSTTTTLVHLMLDAAGMRSMIAGNIGNSLAEEIADRTKGRAMPADTGCIVVEVSSFQLEALSEFRAHGAALLNITPDHLDRYSGMEHYAETKARIFINQKESDFAVLNADDQWTIKVYEHMKSRMSARAFFFSRKARVRGVYVDAGRVMYDIADKSGVLMACSEIGIPGVHNLENAMAASAMALAAGVSSNVIADVLRGFKGLEHRVEFVRELDGVRYINDSKGTNVDAAIKSVQSFKEPVILIAGGRDKAGDFPAFARAIGSRLKAVILIGEAAGTLRSAFRSTTLCMDASSLEDAVGQARSIASAGDVVLLSPACASFDMFRDFEDRGVKFKQAVLAL